MGKDKTEILVYITADEKKIISGDPLVFLIKDPDEQKNLAAELGKTLRANVIQLKNGDFMIIGS